MARNQHVLKLSTLVFNYRLLLFYANYPCGVCVHVATPRPFVAPSQSALIIAPFVPAIIMTRALRAVEGVELMRLVCGVHGFTVWRDIKRAGNLFSQITSNFFSISLEIFVPLNQHETASLCRNYGR